MALTLRRLSGLTLLVAVAGCPKPVSPPVAAASSPTPTVNTGALVQLVSTGTQDPQARDLTYAWAFMALPGGSAATLNDPRSQTPSFIADLPGGYVVQLIVSNAFLSSAPVTVTITASKCGDSAPIAGGLQQTPASPGVGSIVTLSAPSAADPDNTVPGACGTTPLSQKLSYSWKLIAQPASSTATLNNPNAIQPSFTPDVDGDYSFRLVITDSTSRASDPEDLKVTVSKCGEAAPVINSITSNAERPGVGANIQLSASVTNPDADPARCSPPLAETLSYAWSIGTLPQGSHAALNSSTSLNPSFVPDVFGKYIFHLVLTSSNGRSAQLDSPPLDISQCGSRPPVVAINPIAGSEVIGSTVQLSAVVTDPDAGDTTCQSVPKIFTYAWALRALPKGSLAQLNNASSTNPSFVADVATGTQDPYLVGLTVSDQFGHRTKATDLTVSVSPCGNAIPSVSLTPVAPPNAGQQVVIVSVPATADNTATCGGSNGLGETFTYAWKMTSRPLSSNAFVVDPTAASATFTADVASGNYQLSLVVTASNGKSSAPKFIDVVSTNCGTAAPTVSTATATPSAPNPGSPVQLTATAHDVDNDAACRLGLNPSFSWALVSGPSGAALSNPNIFNPTFTPTVTNADYQFSVVATAPNGLSSAPTFVTIHTSSCGSATPTVAIGGPASYSVDPFTTINTLSAAGSTTDNSNACGGAETFTYLWKVDAKPNDSRSAVFSDPTSSAPTFTPDTNGLYQLEVRATATNGLTSPAAYVNVAVDTCALNSPSVASIGTTGGTVGAVVMLSPGAITDNNCRRTNNYVYSWTLSRPANSQSVLSNPAAAAPTFVPDRVGTYQASLIVTNSQGFSSQPVFQSIDAAACGQVAITATPPTFAFLDPAGAAINTLHTSAQVTLTAHFTDSNANTCGALPVAPFGFQWALVSAPAGSRSQLTSSTAPSPTFVPDVPGTYQASVIVTDALGNSSPTQFVSITTSKCGVNVPVVSISPSAAQSSNTYAPNVLGASATDADKNACPARFDVSFTYAWSIASAPPASRSVLSSLTGAGTTFEAFTPGAYTVQVVATAVPSGISSSPTQLGAQLPFTVNACGSAAPVMQGVTTTATAGGAPISRPNVGQSVTLTANATDANSSCGAPAPTYAWSVVSLPSGSGVSTASATNSTFAFMPDVAGSYEFGVIATDINGLASQPLVVAVTTASCGPTFNGIKPGTVAPVIGQSVSLIITPQPPTDVTDLCVANPVYAYSWTLASRPPGSQATLPAATAATTSLTPDVVGNYQVQLVVTDNAGLASAPATLTLTAGACGTALPTLGLISASPAVPDVGARVGLSVPTPGDSNATSCTGLSVTPFSYRWSLIAAPAGSTTTLASANTATPSFYPDIPNANYQFALTVTDALGNVSAPVFKTVTSSLCGGNKPTVSITQTPSVSVDANLPQALAATPADADAACTGFPTTLTTAWSIVSAPVGGHASLTNASGASTSFTASVPGAYVVQAVATSSSNGLTSAPAPVTINVSVCGSSVPVVTGVSVSTSRPLVGTAATLTASSFDPDTVGGGATCGAAPIPGTPSYSWTLVSAPAGNTYSVPTSQVAALLNFTPNVAGTYVFSVTATEVLNASPLILSAPSAPFTVTVPTGTCGPAIATGLTVAPAGAGTLNIGNVINLGSGAITDNCVASGTLSYAWSIVSRPAASGATVSAPTALASSFIPDVAGTYQIQFVVSDSGGFSTVATASVNIGGCTSAPTLSAIAYQATDPVSSAKSSTAIDTGDQVQLSVIPTAGTCAVSAANTFSYDWSILSKPAGSLTVLAGTTGPSPTFIPDVPNGQYQLLLVVKDGLGNASAPLVQALTTVSSCGTHKPTATFTPSSLAPNANAPVTLTATSTVASNAGCPARFAESSLTHAWSVTPPAGGRFSLSSSSGSPVTFAASVPGTYAVSLVSTGNDGIASAASSQNLVVASCGANPPVASLLTASQQLTTPLQWTSAQTAPGTTLDAKVPVQLAATVGTADTAAGCGLTARAFTEQWTLTSVPPGSTTTLLNGNTTTPSLTPDLANGSYTLQLVLTDSAGYSSARSFTFTTGTCGTNAPSATAFSASQTVGATTIVSTNTVPANLDILYPVAISATVSNPDSACAAPSNGVTYAWSFVQLPPGSAATLTGANTATPSFTPDVASATVPYILALTIADPRGNSSTNQFSLKATCGAAAPTVVGGAAGFGAKQILASIVTTNGATNTTVPNFTIARGFLPSGAPQNTGLPFYAGAPVQLFANVADADATNCPTFAETISYAWSFARLPVGSKAALNSTSSQAPSFTPDAPGQYDLQLTVTDSTGRSTTSGSGAALTMVGVCGQQTPTAQIKVTGPIAAPVGATPVEPLNLVTFDGSGSASPDAVPLNLTGPTGCGLTPTLSYKWTVTSRPAGSMATISGAQLINPSLTLDQSGGYGLQLTVSDDQRSGVATVSLTGSSTVAVAATTTGAFTATALDPTTGNPVVAWLDIGAASSPLRVAKCTASCNTNAATWTVLPTVDDLGATPFSWVNDFERPRPLDVKVSSTGVIYVAYGSGPAAPTSGIGPCQMAISSFNGTVWNHPSIPGAGGSCDAGDTVGTQFGRYVALALPGDIPQSVYSYSSHSPNFMTLVDSTCTQTSAALCATNPSYSAAFAMSSPTGTTNLGRWVSLAYDAAGNARISYFIDSGLGVTSLGYSECNSAYCGNAYSAPVAVLSGGDVGRFSSVALAAPGALGNATASGQPRIAYLDRTNGVVKLAHCEGACTTAASWSTATADDGNGGATPSGIDVGLALDSGGNPRIFSRHSLVGTGIDVTQSSSLSSGFSTFTIAGGFGPSFALTGTNGIRYSLFDSNGLRAGAFGP